MEVIWAMILWICLAIAGVAYWIGLAWLANWVPASLTGLVLFLGIVLFVCILAEAFT